MVDRRKFLSLAPAAIATVPVLSPFPDVLTSSSVPIWDTVRSLQAFGVTCQIGYYKSWTGNGYCFQTTLFESSRYTQDKSSGVYPTGTYIYYGRGETPERSTQDSIIAMQKNIKYGDNMRIA